MPLVQYCPFSSLRIVSLAACYHTSGAGRRSHAAVAQGPANSSQRGLHPHALLSLADR
jgi:hypothetical protein